MRRLTSWTVAFVLTLPGPVLAQTLKPADLVGRWVIPHDGKDWADSLAGKLLVDMLTLDADGSYTRETKRKEGDSLVAMWTKAAGEADQGPFRWTLAADTLELRSGEGLNPASYRVGLKDRRLVFWNWYKWDAGRRDEKCADWAFQRLDSSKPLTLPPPPRITIDLADLVGTWAGTYDTKRWGVVTDTLIIGADSTLTTVHVGPSDDAHEKGTWALLPGDELSGPLGNIDRVKVYLQNGELVRCSGNYAVLKRVAP